MSLVDATKENTLIVLALESESNGRFDDFQTVYTGVGKVNAAYKLTRALMQWKADKGEYPSLVINVGTAGSSLFSYASVVNCTQFIQRDMDVSAFGDTLYATPNEDSSPVFSAGLRCEPHAQAVCGSGDSFSTDDVMRGWNVVDMEAYALAKVCMGEGVPFCCLKFVSDGGNKDAAVTWDQALDAGSKALKQAISDILK